MSTTNPAALAILSKMGVRTYTALEDTVLRALAKTHAKAVRLPRALACNHDAPVTTTLRQLTKRKVPLVVYKGPAYNHGYVLTEIGELFVRAQGWA